MRLILALGGRGRQIMVSLRPTRSTRLSSRTVKALQKKPYLKKTKHK